MRTTARVGVVSFVDKYLESRIFCLTGELGLYMITPAVGVVLYFVCLQECFPLFCLFMNETRYFTLREQQPAVAFWKQVLRKGSNL